MLLPVRGGRRAGGESARRPPTLKLSAYWKDTDRLGDLFPWERSWQGGLRCEEVHSRQLKVEGRKDHPVAESDWAGDLFPQGEARATVFQGALSMVAEQLTAVPSRRTTGEEQVPPFGPVWKKQILRFAQDGN